MTPTSFINTDLCNDLLYTVALHHADLHSFERCHMIKVLLSILAQGASSYGLDLSLHSTSSAHYFRSDSMYCPMLQNVRGNGNMNPPIKPGWLPGVCKSFPLPRCCIFVAVLLLCTLCGHWRRKGDGSSMAATQAERGEVASVTNMASTMYLQSRDDSLAQTSPRSP